jgi:hypothetical protein
VSGAKRSPVSALWHAATRAIHPLAAALQAQTTPRAYLPFVPRSLCPGQVLANGDFEQGAEGRHQYTTGTGYKAHDLIGSDAGGFQPYLGHYGARLGGYEGTWDVLTRTVSIPAGGRLSYWWQMHTYETTIFHDNLQVDLLTIEGEIVAHLAGHGIEGQEGIWQQDVVDVSAHAGRTLVLRFHAYNDNYYFSWFDLDQVCLHPGRPEADWGDSWEAGPGGRPEAYNRDVDGQVITTTEVVHATILSTGVHAWRARAFNDAGYSGYTGLRTPKIIEPAYLVHLPIILRNR